MSIVFKNSNPYHSQRASALIISLLLMGFLTVLGLGLSRVVIDSIRIESGVVEAGKAYFSAEAGIERGLYAEEHFLPGYEITESIDLINATHMDYRLVAQGEQVPCDHRPEDMRLLEVQESVSLPLYRWDETTGRYEAESFQVEYSLDRGGDGTPVVGTVLRWKIVGIDSVDGHTEAISGIDPGVIPFLLNSEEDSANFYDGTPGSTFVNYSAYPIDEFLVSHRFNTLVLTNVIEPLAQAAHVQEPEVNRVLIKLSVPNATACEYALIEADGVSGEHLQSLDVQVRLDSALPVYDFALYQTE